MNVKVYSTPTCPYCKMVKQHLGDNNISYDDIDVSGDQAAANEMVEKTGQMGVPVTIIEKNGEESIVIGFDKDRLSEILELT